MKDHFRQCGDVARVEVHPPFEGQFAGSGTVLFRKKEDAEAAVSRLNGSDLQGSQLEVRLE